MKRVLSAVLALLFIVLSLPFTASRVSAAELFPDLAPAGKYTEGLGITQKRYDELRARVCGAARGCAPVCDLSDFGFYYGSETALLLAYLLYDYDVESFHVSNVSFSTNGAGKIRSMNLTYDCTAKEYAAKKAQLKAAADKILSGIEGSSLTDLQKALLIHDRLAVSCEYNVWTYDSGEYVGNDYNAYGGLVEHITKCEGYSKAYSYLLNRVGIKSCLVNSKALKHMWNEVQIDGEWYHVDVTWDDATPSRQGGVEHSYFLRSTPAFRSLGHNASDYDATPLSTLYDGVFVWTNSYTEFVICSGDIYYISGGILYKWDGVTSEQIADFSGSKWYVSIGTYYRKGFHCLSTDGDYLYVSYPMGISRVNPQNKDVRSVYTYRADGYWYIYGMTYRNGEFLIDPYNSADFENDTEKLYGFTVPYIPPAPHDNVPGEPVIEEPVEATCEKNGSYYETVYCTVCGEMISRTPVTVQALGHDYVHNVIEKTCTVDGVNESVCSRCGKVEYRRIYPASHKFGNIYTTRAKCTEDGGKKRVCSICGYVEITDVVPALGHDFSEEFTIDREATYTEDGQMSRHCSRCREKADITVIPKLISTIPGDVNGDGDVNVKDVLIARRVIAGLAEIGEDEYARADMNGDGDVTSKDVLKMRRYIAGLD